MSRSSSSSRGSSRRDFSSSSAAISTRNSVAASRSSSPRASRKSRYVSTTSASSTSMRSTSSRRTSVSSRSNGPLKTSRSSSSSATVTANTVAALTDEQRRVMHREEAPSHGGRHPQRSRADRPLHAAAAVEAVHLERERVAELARHAQARLARDPVHVGAREALDVPDPLRLGDLAGPLRAQVVLQRDLDDDLAADARGLAQQRHGIRDVLEHVAQHPQVERAVEIGR